VNARIRGLGETVLRVKDLPAVRRFYTEVVGLEILQEFDGITFLKVADGYGGHTQIVGLFHESMPVPFPGDPRGPFVSSRHHCITSRSRSTSVTSTLSWPVSWRLAWRSPRSSIAGAGGGPCTCEIRRAISWSSCATTRRSARRGRG
jgi:hypothetical protein